MFKPKPSLELTGLKRMKRSHIHFAISDKLTNDKNQSGIRNNCELLIYLNVELAINEGIELFISDNNVVLSQGIGKDGCILPKYFEMVIDRKTGKEV